MATGGFSSKGLARVRDVVAHQVESGFAPGAVGVLARRGEVHVVASGTLAFEGTGAGTPMAADTICRTASMTKPLVAACAMTLVDDRTLRLDDPVDDLLPELADMTVLADFHGPLDDTVPARRRITLRDLLAYTCGIGVIPTKPGKVPLIDALNALDYSTPDEWMRGLGALPLAHQPGERWLYDTASNVTGVLIARATGMSFGDAFRERLCEPLGMKDTAFSVSGEDIARLATAYQRDSPATGARVVDDGPDGRWSRPPVFESGGGGLVSTAQDYFAFAAALLAGGTHRGRRVFSRSAVTLMTTDQLTPAQRENSGFWPGFFNEMGWGFGMSVLTRPSHHGPSAGSYGWSGFYGTAWYNDPAQDLTALFFMQRGHAGDQRLPVWQELWPAVYQAIED
ncbi:CubicO group peptidase (beta-lactamase class C family) [Saccharothrix saharensis]|uniref:CubicO group peptidase (Beta-lactamase class C family) n=1 Tax=Saccharothrix saharensis TaxID=571190 RepID=A0A543JR62_9PSEU|nr:serine hydrolase domain-containing protein [Saccharothrix saharensis]TQM85329.1 CubicO group peptidase (beta-lactamase class C family) [Saccharothrix saharensis]